MFTLCTNFQSLKKPHIDVSFFYILSIYISLQNLNPFTLNNFKLGLQLQSCRQIMFVYKEGKIAGQETGGWSRGREKRRRRSAEGQGAKERRRVRVGTERGLGSQVFAESAGAGAINLAGISELMNVIKIQPPASWTRARGRVRYRRVGRYRQCRRSRRSFLRWEPAGASRSPARTSPKGQRGRPEWVEEEKRAEATRRNGYEEIPPPVIPP